MRRPRQNDNVPFLVKVCQQRLLSEYVVEDMLPPSTADSPAFKKLICGVLAIQVPGRKALTVHLDKVFDAMNPKLKDILEKVNFVSTTANVWKACNKGFYGMTAQWIDPNTLQRCKAALSCSRFTGHNTYDVLAERIESVHRQFGLNGKVTATITIMAQICQGIQNLFPRYHINVRGGYSAA